MRVSFLAVSIIMMMTGFPAIAQQNNREEATDYSPAVYKARIAISNALAVEVTATAVGEYKPLTLWSQITFGSLYYTNPKAARDIEFAYSFDTIDFSQHGKVEKIVPLVISGDLFLGVSGTDDTAPNNSMLLRVSSMNTLGSAYDFIS